MKKSLSSAVNVFLIGIFIFCLALSAAAQNPRITLLYNTFTLKTPAMEEPFPGMGNNLSCLSKGMVTALWNPAGLINVATAEYNLSLMQTTAPVPFSNSTNLQDQVQTLGSSNEAQLLILFTGNQSESTAKTREAVANSRAESLGTAVSLSEALKITDWLAIGFMTKGDYNAGAEVGGTVPMVSKYIADFSNYNLGSGLTIVNGKLRYSSGGTTYETTQTLWSGFTTQVSTIPANTYCSFNNNVDVQNNLIVSAATKYGPVAFGCNFIPISATMHVDNTAKTIIADNTSDLTIYTPKLNPSDPAEIVKWIQDPDLYGGVKGYRNNRVLIPSGQAIVDSAFKGNYSGSTFRTDLGTLIDVGEDVTASIVMENYNGANLKLTGSGISSYVVHRINTQEAVPTIDPTKDFSWNPFLDAPTPYGDYSNYALVTEKTFSLPQRLRVGMLFKKPFIFALEYEKQLNAYEVSRNDSSGATVTTKIKNLQLIRLGMEGQILLFPVWYDFGTAFMLKPEVEGVDAAAYEQQINQAFSIFGGTFCPVKLDLGLKTKAGNTAFGFASGVNALSLLDTVQLDTVNPDVTQTAYLSVYVDQEWWRFTYGINMDTAGTMGSVLSKSSSGSININDFSFNDIKWCSTYMLSFKF